MTHQIDCSAITAVGNYCDCGFMYTTPEEQVQHLTERVIQRMKNGEMDSVCPKCLTNLGRVHLSPYEVGKSCKVCKAIKEQNNTPK
jgi:hypothetical protein